VHNPERKRPRRRRRDEIKITSKKLDGMMRTGSIGLSVGTVGTEKNEMGRECSPYGGEERRKQSFGGKT
jgi:hypothetical protein